MTNSPLVSYTKISPNKTSPRNHSIDTITIHCVVGQLSVESLGNVFAPTSRQASSNYGIGSDGRIGMYVEEKDRSWCSSSKSNDHRAITIECASDTKSPYTINDKVYESLINLCVDICKRNDIKELKWKADKSLIGKVDEQNVTVHRWFANTECPGEYIFSRLGQIVSRVNTRLNQSILKHPSIIYRVQTGAFSNKKYAEELLTRVKASCFDTYMTKVDNLYKIQVGAYSKIENAENTARQLKEAGFDVYITQSFVEKSIDELANEVIIGKWGNGQERIDRLTAAGYDYSAIQRRVNEIT